MCRRAVRRCYLVTTPITEFNHLSIQRLLMPAAAKYSLISAPGGQSGRREQRLGDSRYVRKRNFTVWLLKGIA